MQYTSHETRNVAPAPATTGEDHMIDEVGPPRGFGA